MNAAKEKNMMNYRAATKPEWLAMAAGSRLLVVAGRALGSERVKQLWEVFEQASAIQAVLDELTRSGISTTPEFALLSWDRLNAGTSGDLHLIVRGQLRVTTDALVSQTFDGLGVSTWNERIVAGAPRFQVDTKPSAAGAPDLPLSVGCAWIESIASSAPPVATIEPSAATLDLSAAPPTAREMVSGRAAVSEPGAPSETTMIEFLHEDIQDVEPVREEGGAGMADEGEPSAVPANTGYDYLFGETIARTVEDAAVRSSDGDGDLDESGVGANNATAGDHDGRTAVGLSRAERQAARRARAGSSLPLVDGPKLFIDFSAGTTEPLDGPLVIGRAPSVSQVSGDKLPRLVTITGSDQDISRNHLQVTVEGGTTVVTDLHSRNGTMIVLPGRAPQQLRAGEPTAVIVGTTVDLGAGVTFTVREE